VVVGGGVALDEQDVAVKADGADHVDVQGLLTGPAAVGGGQGGGGAGLADLLEAAVGDRAGRQAVLGTVGGQVGGGVGVVVGVDDGHRQARSARRGQVVRAVQVGRAEAGGRGVRGHGVSELLRDVGPPLGEAGDVAGGRGAAQVLGR